MRSTNSKLILYKAILRPNYPVCEGYIIFSRIVRLQAEDLETHVESLARELGFQYPEPLEITLLGAYQPLTHQPNGVVSYANGEY